jgi:chromosome segregation ATPase
MEWTQVVALLGALGGLAGVASLIRAYGQNRTDATATLVTAQSSFQDNLLEEVARLRAEVKSRDAEMKQLIQVHAESQSKIITLEAKVESLTQRLAATMMALDMAGRESDKRQKRIEQLEDEVHDLKRPS